MTSVELKKEIHKTIDQIPESSLKDILLYLNTLKSASTDKVALSNQINKILKEDNELLQKLAL